MCRAILARIFEVHGILALPSTAAGTTTDEGRADERSSGVS